MAIFNSKLLNCQRVNYSYLWDHPWTQVNQSCKVGAFRKVWGKNSNKRKSPSAWYIYRETSYLFYLSSKGLSKTPLTHWTMPRLYIQSKTIQKQKQLGIKNYKDLYFLIGGFLKAGDTQSHPACHWLPSWWQFWIILKFIHVVYTNVVKPTIFTIPKITIDGLKYCQMVDL